MDFNQIKTMSSKGTSYLTHNFHTYPAKYIPQIPRYFIEKYTKMGDTVYDPFVGCGTTLVECKLLSRNGVGVDSNPIATLVSKSKTTPLSDDEILCAQEFVASLTSVNVSEVNVQLPTFHNIDHWFSKDVQLALAVISKLIGELDSDRLQNFLNTVFSSIIVEVSNQESDTRYARKDSTFKTSEVISLFSRKANSMLLRMEQFSRVASLSTDIRVFNKSSQQVEEILDESVDLVITSPPYANTYDYYLYHKHRINWLGYNLKEVQATEIGSRHRHSSMKLEIDDFLSNLNECFRDALRTLKIDGHFVVVIGDSVIRGKHFDAIEFTNEIMLNSGCVLIESSSQQLKKSTRMFNPKFTNASKNEHLLVYQKVKV